jgi:hypothetical protein
MAVSRAPFTFVFAVCGANTIAVSSVALQGERAMSRSLYDSAEIEVICPRCGSRNRKSIRSLYGSPKIYCEECGAEGTIDNEKLRSTLKKIEQGWREASATISETTTKH